MSPSEHTVPESGFPPTHPDGGHSDHLGARIRAIRRQREVTGAELARKASVSPSYLSRLENGRVSPTVSTLTRIMGALGVPVSRVFGESSGGPVVRKHERRLIPSRRVEDYLLSPTRAGRFEVLETVIEPRGESGDAPHSHPGDEECIVVLEGEFRFWLGEVPYVLFEGDAITFPPRTPHRWENPGEKRARVLWVISPARSY
jgi:transcriptional regulator with XRE-family HTH domain